MNSSDIFHQNIPIPDNIMSNSDLFLLQDDREDDDPNVPLSFLDECHRRASPSDQEDDNSHLDDRDQEYDQDDHDLLGQRDGQEHDDDNDDQQELKTKDLEVEAKKKEEKEDVIEQIITYDEECLKTAPSSVAELALKVDDDDDGFKTPTSLDHKIPVRQQCPSAPRKPKISSKRKAAPSSSRTSTACRTLHLDFSEQIGSMFPDLQCRRKIKKARRADQQAE